MEIPTAETQSRVIPTAVIPTAGTLRMIPTAEIPLRVVPTVESLLRCTLTADPNIPTADTPPQEMFNAEVLLGVIPTAESLRRVIPTADIA